MMSDERVRVMDIGGAVEAMRCGRRVARAGWNGRGMYIYLVPGAYKAVGHNIAPFVMMHPAAGDEVPWLCSQTDLLAQDWMEVLTHGGATYPLQADGFKHRWQAPLAEWQARELPCEDAARQRLRLALGVAEEAGEVARCVLKGDQDIRGSAEAWREKLGGEIGDVVVYLIQLATLHGLDFEDCVEGSVVKVLGRRFATKGEGA